MAYKLRIMEKAEADISETLANPKAADSLLEDFLAEAKNISENPYMYPLSNDPHLQAEGYHRFLFKRNYVALYLIDDESGIVSIMRIFYAKRDYGNLL